MEKQIVIPVMGPSGAGKSTFINTILKQEHPSQRLMMVGYTLESCTKTLHASRINSSSNPALQQHPVYLVDTPGFDDTYEGDANILRRIATWLKTVYKDAILGGVIYLHDISQDRFSGTARRNLELFHNICGNDAFASVVIGTTKWGKTEHETAEKHEAELKEKQWKVMIDNGTQVSQHLGNFDTARVLVDLILDQVDPKNPTVLEIQTEIAVQKKYLPETRAGTQLRYTLQELQKIQEEIVDCEKACKKAGDSDAKAKLDEARRKHKVLDKQVNELRLGIRQRMVRKFFRH